MSTEQVLPLSKTGKSLRDAQESLSLAISLLLSYNGGGSVSPKAFYAHFLMRMNVLWVNEKECPTMGVSITDKVNLYINAEFFNQLNLMQQLEALEHEIEHIVYLHPIRAKDYIAGGNEKDMKRSQATIANIAMDAGINENKPNLVDFNEGIISFDRLNKQLKQMKSPFQLDKKDPWEVNYEKLFQTAKDNSEGEGDGEGFGDTFDDHSKWKEGDANGTSKEIAEGIVRETANKAQAATGIGNMPEHMLRQISDLNKAIINWKRELRRFFVNSLTFDYTRTRNRRNRRYGVIQPGRKKKPNLHVAICVDSSGSVYDQLFSQFFSEIDAICDLGVQITVLDADCEVAAIYKYEKKMAIERRGGGGTAYSPAIKKAVELGADGIIYCGDFDCADKPQDPKIPFLWVGVDNGSPKPGNFGGEVRIPMKEINGR